MKGATRIAAPTSRTPSCKWLWVAITFTLVITSSVKGEGTGATLLDTLATRCPSFGLSMESVTTGRTEVAVSSNTSTADGRNSICLHFAAGDDFSEVARRFVVSSGLTQGGGCETPECVEDLLLGLIESEALHTPAFKPHLVSSSSNQSTDPGVYTSLADACLHQAVPGRHPSSSHQYLLSLLDEASSILGCPSPPSLYLHHYWRAASSGSSPFEYPRLCQLGRPSYAACACVLVDSITAHVLLLGTQDSDSAEQQHVLMLTLVKDLGILLTSLSGAVEHSVPLSDVNGGMALLSVQLLELLLADFPADTQARRLAGSNRLLLGHADRAALHYALLVPRPSLPLAATPAQGVGPSAAGNPRRRVLRGLFRLLDSEASATQDGDAEEREEVMQVSLLQVAHDREQLEWLMGRGLLPRQTYHAVAEEYAALAGELRRRQREKGERAGGQLDEELAVATSDYPLVAATYRTLVYLAPTPSLPEGALSRAWHGPAVEAEFSTGQVAVLDQAMSGAALRGLLDLCRDSTVFHEARSNGYLGAYADHTGFASGLLLQVALELKQRLPNLLGHHRIRRVWAYKYDQNHTGISPHADDASVTVNCWITPEESLTEGHEGRGGMALFKDVRIPSTWSFHDYTNPSKVTELLLSHPTGLSSYVLIPYRQNRCVAFRSSIVHQSDNVMPFRQGYANRRINLTFLYGSMFKDDE